jgi:hypothetical protein
MLMVEKKEILTHLQKHVVYPASRKDIIEACNMLMDVPQADKEWFEKNMPDWNYRNADEVLRAVDIVSHLEHVEYPTTKKDLVKACNKMDDVPKAYREWFERNLPEGAYRHRDEVIGTFKGMIHVREHVVYPATKSVILEGCNKMTEVPKESIAYFEKYLPDRLYKNPDDVIKSFKP